MRYLLTRLMMNHKYARWMVILQEFYLQFNSPKRKKALILVEFIIDLPIETLCSPVNEAFPYEHIFLVSTDDPWYGHILLFLRTQKFKPQHTCDDRRCIHQKAPRYILLGDVLYQRGIDTILCRCLDHHQVEQALNDCHSGACGGHLLGMIIT